MVSVEELALCNGLTFLCIHVNQVVSDLDQTIAEVDVSFHEAVQVRLEATDQFLVHDLGLVIDVLAIDVKNGDEFVTLIFQIFDARQNDQPLLCVVNSKVEYFSPSIKVFVNLSRLSTSK